MGIYLEKTIIQNNTGTPILTAAPLRVGKMWKQPNYPSTGVDKDVHTGLCWRLSGRQSACQFRTRRFVPWSRKIPHVKEQLSLCSRAWELQSLSPHALEPMLHNRSSYSNEKDVVPIYSGI